jgi:ubiquinone/menaquinone biosynthesis C-methylase UbiE
VIDSNDVQAHITGFWSTVAADYDAHAGNVAEHGSVEYRRWVDVLASVLPDPPGDVLDVATGSGYVALAAASIGQRVTAIDLAPAMLEELVANATARSLTVDARLGDAVAPDFAPASFDAVTSRHLLWTLREPARAMVNWRRLLRPGGRLVAVDGSGLPSGTMRTYRHCSPSITQQVPGESSRSCTSTGRSRSSNCSPQTASWRWRRSPGQTSA